MIDNSKEAQVEAEEVEEAATEEEEEVSREVASKYKEEVDCKEEAFNQDSGVADH